MNGEINFSDGGTSCVSVPPSATYLVSVRYVFGGQGKPLPYDLPEDDYVEVENGESVIIRGPQ